MMHLLILAIFAVVPVPVRVSDYYADDGSFTTLPTAPARADGLRLQISDDFAAEIVLVDGKLRVVAMRSVVHGWRTR